MAASATDLLQKVGTPGTATTLAAPGYTNGVSTSITVGSTTNWPSDTGVSLAIDVVDSSGVQVPGTYCEFVGTVASATSVTSLSKTFGTSQNYAAGATTRVYIPVSSTRENRLVQWGLAHANQDGSLLTSAVQSALSLGTGSLNGWNALGFAPATVTNNGNRSYDLVFTGQDLTGTLSAGMRLRTTRTVAAPTQCTSLNGTTQYYSKTSPASMTFTNNFVVGGWVKLTSYPSSVEAAIISRYAAASGGWYLTVSSSGQVTCAGYSGSSANASYIQSYQSIPLNKWVHIAAQLDMTTTTTTGGTANYIMIDGVDVPCVMNRFGTSPTSLTQAGNLEVGSHNGGTKNWPGKIAQAFVASAKITQANVRTLMSQGLTTALCTANNIISAYSFNASTSDITVAANNLTANGSAVATNADSPFGTQAGGSISSTLDYAIIQAATFSTNTTITVQVPEGNAIPTSGGVSAVVYSSAGKPYGMPLERGRWAVSLLIGSPVSTAGTVAATIYNPGGINLAVPTGAWRLSLDLLLVTTPNASAPDVSSSLSPVATTMPLPQYTTRNLAGFNSSNPQVFNHSRSDFVTTTSQTPYYVVIANYQVFSSFQIHAGIGGASPWSSVVVAENAYL